MIFKTILFLGDMTTVYNLYICIFKQISEKERNRLMSKHVEKCSQYTG